MKDLSSVSYFDFLTWIPCGIGWLDDIRTSLQWYIYNRKAMYELTHDIYVNIDYEQLRKLFGKLENYIVQPSPPSSPSTLLPSPSHVPVELIHPIKQLNCTALSPNAPAYICAIFDNCTFYDTPHHFYPPGHRQTTDIDRFGNVSSSIISSIDNNISDNHVPELAYNSDDKHSSGTNAPVNHQYGYHTHHYDSPSQMNDSTALIFANDSNQHPHDDYHSLTTHNDTDDRHDAYDDAHHDDTYHNDTHNNTNSYHDPPNDNNQDDYVHDNGYHSS